ncbi:MAG: EF-hand domain-containing protein [Verrucomicrobiales bacterium]|nr:EF-hand domain-containing protein [Verrucomicrobiales bacterium]
MKEKKYILPLSLVAAVALPVGYLVAQDTDSPKPEKKEGKKEACATCKGGEKGRPDLAAKFAEIDADNDGKITEAEAIQAQQKRVAEFAKKRFASMDLDENGVVTETEMKIAGKRGPSDRGPRGGKESAHRKGRGGPEAHRGEGPRRDFAFHGRSRGGKDGHRHGSFERRGPGKGGECGPRGKDMRKGHPGKKDIQPEAAPAAESTEPAESV